MLNTMWMGARPSIPLKVGYCRQLLAPRQGPTVLGDISQGRMGLWPRTGSLYSSYSVITTFLSMSSLELWTLCESENGH